MKELIQSLTGGTKKGSLSILFTKVTLLLVLMLGLSSIHGACSCWWGQPELPQKPTEK